MTVESSVFQDIPAQKSFLIIQGGAPRRPLQNSKSEQLRRRVYFPWEFLPPWEDRAGAQPAILQRSTGKTYQAQNRVGVAAPAITEIRAFPCS